nr:MAG TPA: hypothetical protein [Caudoviricetes sp.]
MPTIEPLTPPTPLLTSLSSSRQNPRCLCHATTFSYLHQ